MHLILHLQYITATPNSTMQTHSHTRSHLLLLPRLLQHIKVSVLLEFYLSVALIKAEEESSWLILRERFWGVAVVVSLGHQRTCARRLWVEDSVLGGEDPQWDGALGR